MAHVRDRAYPAPAVYDAGEGYLVMQRLDGPTMLAAALKRPSALAESGRNMTEAEKARMRRMAKRASERNKPHSHQ